MVGLMSQLTIAQDGKLLARLSDEEQQTIEAIALYPEKERTAILEAAMHPEILVRIQRAQNLTSREFQDLISALPENDQKKMYDLVRFPDLIAKVTAGGKRKSDKEIRKLAADLPEELQQQVVWANKEHFELLQRIEVLYTNSEESFENLLVRYPTKTANAYRELIKMPEVLQTLSENMSATVLLGDVYGQDPQGVKNTLDSLNVVLAEQKSRELNEWKQSLEENPEALKEYQQAAREFAAEQGYDETDYSEPLAERFTTNVYVHHIWQPYPYWFGWPYWYDYGYWYPYPWWYHWGYYYGPGDVIVFVGLPSYSFVYWHMYHHRHHYYYPHFTNTIIRYTERNPRQYNNVTRVATRWQRDISRDVPDNWLTNDGKRVERIKEYGEFKMAYNEEVRSRSTGVISEQEYLESNPEKYPNLKRVLQEKPAADRAGEITAPVKRPVDRAKPQMEKPREEQKPQQQPLYRSRTKVSEDPQFTPQKIERARTYHENKWEKPQAPKVPREVNPPARSAPVQRDIPKTSVPTPSRERTVPGRRGE